MRNDGYNRDLSSLLAVNEPLPSLRPFWTEVVRRRIWSVWEELYGIEQNQQRGAYYCVRLTLNEPTSIREPSRIAKGVGLSFGPIFIQRCTVISVTDWMPIQLPPQHVLFSHQRTALLGVNCRKME